MTDVSEQIQTIRIGGLDAPADLQAGDMLLVRPHDANNKLKGALHRCLALGFEFDTDDKPAGVWIMSFGKTGKVPGDYDLAFDESAAEHLPGVEFPAVLHADRIELVPFRQKFFSTEANTGNTIVPVTRLGKVTPDFLAGITDTLDALKAEGVLASPRGPKRGNNAYVGATLQTAREDAVTVPGVPMAPVTWRGPTQAKPAERSDSFRAAAAPSPLVAANALHFLPDHPMFGQAGENYSRIAGQVVEGDVVTAHVSNINDSRDNRKVYRPCIVLDVFEEEGTNLPVGLMLLPCSRVSHWNFPDKVRLRNPFSWRKQRMPSFAVTDRVIVAPLTHRYIPGYHHVSNHLPDPLYNRIVDRFHQTLDEKLERVGIYGWSQLPAGWQSRRLKTVATHLAALPDADQSVRDLLRDIRDHARTLPKTDAGPEAGSPETILTEYLQLRRLETDFDLKPKPEAQAAEGSTIAGTAAEEDAEALPLEQALPALVREKAEPVLPDDLQVGTIVTFHIPQRGYHDFSGRWQPPRLQSQQGLVWMVFRDPAKGHVSGAGVIPFETKLNHYDFQPLDGDEENMVLPSWQHACLEPEDIERTNAPGRGRFMMNTLHMLSNNAKFFEPRRDWPSARQVSPAVMPELVARREEALLNAPCHNRGFNIIPRDWVFAQAPRDRDGESCLRLPPDAVESLVFAPDLRRVQQAFQFWQNENGLLPPDHVPVLPPLTVERGRFVAAPAPSVAT